MKGKWKRGNDKGKGEAKRLKQGKLKGLRAKGKSERGNYKGIDEGK